MFEIHRGLSLKILRETFVSKTSSYDLRRNDTFEKLQVYSVCHNTEWLSFLGPKIWDLVPVELKQWYMFMCMCMCVCIFVDIYFSGEG